MALRGRTKERIDNRVEIETVQEEIIIKEDTLKETNEKPFVMDIFSMINHNIKKDDDTEEQLETLPNPHRIEIKETSTMYKVLEESNKRGVFKDLQDDTRNETSVQEKQKCYLFEIKEIVYEKLYLVVKKVEQASSEKTVWEYMNTKLGYSEEERIISNTYKIPIRGIDTLYTTLSTDMFKQVKEIQPYLYDIAEVPNLYQKSKSNKFKKAFLLDIRSIDSLYSTESKQSHSNKTIHNKPKPNYHRIKIDVAPVLFNIPIMSVSLKNDNHHRLRIKEIENLYNEKNKPNTNLQYEEEHLKNENYASNMIETGMQQNKNQSDTVNNIGNHSYNDKEGNYSKIEIVIPQEIYKIQKETGVSQMDNISKDTSNYYRFPIDTVTSLYKLDKETIQKETGVSNQDETSFIPYRLHLEEPQELYKMNKPTGVSKAVETQSKDNTTTTNRVEPKREYIPFHKLVVQEIETFDLYTMVMGGKILNQKLNADYVKIVKTNDIVKSYPKMYYYVPSKIGEQEEYKPLIDNETISSLEDDLEEVHEKVELQPTPQPQPVQETEPQTTSIIEETITDTEEIVSDKDIIKETQEIETGVSEPPQSETNESELPQEDGVSFYKGMPLTDFLEENIDIRGIKEVRKYFTKEEIELNAQYGVIMFKKGRIIY